MVEIQLDNFKRNMLQGGSQIKLYDEDEDLEDEDLDDEDDDLYEDDEDDEDDDDDWDDMDDEDEDEDSLWD